MTPSLTTTILSYVPEFYPTFGAVLVGLGEAFVILLGLGYGLHRLLRAPASTSTTSP
jgi:hypothetical protein